MQKKFLSMLVGLVMVGGLFALSSSASDLQGPILMLGPDPDPLHSGLTDANDANLADLSVDQASLNPSFDPAIFSYTDLIGTGATEINITPTADNPNATITINGIPVANDTALDVTNLVIGNNIFTITVTAQNGITTQSYILTVIRQPSSDTSIVSFNFTSPASTGVVDNIDRTISLTVPFGTDVTLLTPTIVVAPDATISPLSGVAQDFTEPVTYTVTAQDGSSQDYMATVTVAPKTHTLTYVAGTNGSVTGSATQTVNHGANGTAVTAVADPGFHFTSWSDSSSANPRTDSNVIDDLTVTAQFAANASSGGGGGGGGGGGSQVVLKPGNIKGYGVVNEYDLSVLMAQWGQTGANLSGDLNHDSIVNEYDLAIMMANWGL